MQRTHQAGTGLVAPIFTSDEMAAGFSDRAFLQAMLDVEAALAAAEAETGVIPASHAEMISDACRAERYDIDALGHAAAKAGNPAIPLVKALTAQVEGEAARSVHWGATSQDIIDTALMLMMRNGLGTLSADLASAIAAGITLCETHPSLMMAGRTLLQQALPILFGHKVAGWLSGLVAARVSVRRLADEEIALQFAGAAGTLASLGEQGPAVRSALARQLRLNEPHTGWHTERSRIATIGCSLGVISGTAAKIAADIVLMMQTEIGEILEPTEAGRGGSSTLPHKRNPIAGSAIRANHHRISGLVSTLLAVVEAEHERAAGAWGAEWDTIRDLFRLCGGSIHLLSETLEALEVQPERMAANLEATGGMLMAESLMMALAPKMGRLEAHRLVEETVKAALAEGNDLQSAAVANPRIGAHLTEAEVAAAFEPRSYLGSAASMIDAVLGEARRELGNKWQG